MVHYYRSILIRVTNFNSSRFLIGIQIDSLRHPTLIGSVNHCKYLVLPSRCASSRLLANKHFIEKCLLKAQSHVELFASNSETNLRLTLKPEENAQGHAILVLGSVARIDILAICLPLAYLSTIYKSFSLLFPLDRGQLCFGPPYLATLTPGPSMNLKTTRYVHSFALRYFWYSAPPRVNKSKKCFEKICK